LRYWRIWIGYRDQPDKFVLTARRHGYIAIEWNELGDLSRFKDEDELTKNYEKVYGKPPASSEVRTLWGFVKEVNIGDVVLVPHRGEVVFVGSVQGPYVHSKDWKDICDFLNRRRVEWFKEIEWDDLSERLRKVIGTPSTLINLDDYASEVEFHLIAKGHPT
jgi:predicted Mrr-cat superfamily restriction endonuclease